MHLTAFLPFVRTNTIENGAKLWNGLSKKAKLAPWLAPYKTTFKNFIAGAQLGTFEGRDIRIMFCIFINGGNSVGSLLVRLLLRSNDTHCNLFSQERRENGDPRLNLRKTPFLI